ncbi:MAG: tRNA (N6-threonylcarbamoyladenosine(37)-N6)-methyltransferase TrmO [Chloroflexota bacterium]
MTTNTNGKSYHIYPIGQVRRSDGEIRLEIMPPYRPALKQLEHFSHVMVFWWADLVDSQEYRQVLDCHPPYAEQVLTGVFATRSPMRPNPIVMTTCKLLSVDEATGILRIADIDAFDTTPVIDLKAYFPVCDRVQQASIPAWLEGWPEWMLETGIGLEEHEADAFAS